MTRHMVALWAVGVAMWLFFDVSTVWSLPFLIPFTVASLVLLVLRSEYDGTRLNNAPLQNMSHFVHHRVSPDLLCSATELGQRIRFGLTSSTAVVATHINQIVAVNPALNALVVDCFDDAQARATAIDDYFRRRRAACHRLYVALCALVDSGNALDVSAADIALALSDPPPFLGVPFTTKECFSVAGLPSTSGLVSRAPTSLIDAATAHTAALSRRARLDAAAHAASSYRSLPALAATIFQGAPLADPGTAPPPARALTQPFVACPAPAVCVSVGAGLAPASSALPTTLATAGAGADAAGPQGSWLRASPGYAAGSRGVSLYTSPSVQRLQRAGLVLLGVSNTSELCMWMESGNAVYGRSNNPYDLARTPGGSSGGEAAIISALGSPLGMGSDVGGSIRMPCFFTGLYGHKPSGGATGNRGQWPPSAAADVTLLAHQRGAPSARTVLSSSASTCGPAGPSAGAAVVTAWPLAGETERICQTGPIARHPADLWPALLAIRGAPLPRAFSTVTLASAHGAGRGANDSAAAAAASAANIAAVVAGGIEVDPAALPAGHAHVTTAPIVPAAVTAAVRPPPQPSPPVPLSSPSSGSVFRTLTGKAAAMLGLTAITVAPAGGAVPPLPDADSPHAHARVHSGGSGSGGGSAGSHSSSAHSSGNWTPRSTPRGSLAGPSLGLGVNIGVGVNSNGNGISVVHNLSSDGAARPRGGSLCIQAPPSPPARFAPAFTAAVPLPRDSPTSAASGSSSSGGGGNRPWWLAPGVRRDRFTPPGVAGDGEDPSPHGATSPALRALVETRDERARAVAAGSPAAKGDQPAQLHAALRKLAAAPHGGARAAALRWLLADPLFVFDVIYGGNDAADDGATPEQTAAAAVEIIDAVVLAAPAHAHARAHADADADPEAGGAGAARGPSGLSVRLDDLLADADADADAGSGGGIEFESFDADAYGRPARPDRCALLAAAERERFAEFRSTEASGTAACVPVSVVPHRVRSAAVALGVTLPPPSTVELARAGADADAAAAAASNLGVVADAGSTGSLVSAPDAAAVAVTNIVPAMSVAAAVGSRSGDTYAFAVTQAQPQLQSQWPLLPPAPPALLSPSVVRPSVPAPYCGVSPSEVPISQMIVYYLPTVPPVGHRWRWPRWLWHRARALGVVGASAAAAGSVAGGVADADANAEEEEPPVETCSSLSQTAEPAVQASVYRALAALRRAGVPASNIRPLPLPSLGSSFDIWSACVASAGASAFRDLLLQMPVDLDADAAPGSPPAVCAEAAAASAEKARALSRLYEARLDLFLLSDAWLLTKAVGWLAFRAQASLRPNFFVHPIPDVYAVRARAEAAAKGVSASGAAASASGGGGGANGGLVAACAVPVTAPAVPALSLFNRALHEAVVVAYILLHVVLCAAAPSLTPHTLPALLLCLVEAVAAAAPALRRHGLQRAREAAALLNSVLAGHGDDTGKGRPGRPAVLVLPPHPVLAPRHLMPYWTPFNVAYTALFNALQLPATSVPMGLDVCRDGHYHATRWYDYAQSRADAAAEAALGPAEGADAEILPGSQDAATAASTAALPGLKVIAPGPPSSSPGAAVAAEASAGFVPTLVKRHPGGRAFASAGLGSGPGIWARALCGTLRRCWSRRARRGRRDWPRRHEGARDDGHGDGGSGDGSVTAPGSPPAASLPLQLPAAATSAAGTAPLAPAPAAAVVVSAADPDAPSLLDKLIALATALWTTGVMHAGLWLLTLRASLAAVPPQRRELKHHLCGWVILVGGYLFTAIVGQDWSFEDPVSLATTPGGYTALAAGAGGRAGSEPIPVVHSVPQHHAASGVRLLPTGVQVVSAFGCDGVTIAAALAIHTKVGGWVPPPPMHG